MAITLEVYVGIDVSKDQLDVAIGGEKSRQEVANSKRGIAKVVKQMVVLLPKLVVVEATGATKKR